LFSHSTKNRSRVTTLVFFFFLGILLLQNNRLISQYHCSEYSKYGTSTLRPFQRYAFCQVWTRFDSKILSAVL